MSKQSTCPILEGPLLTHALFTPRMGASLIFYAESWHAHDMLNMTSRCPQPRDAEDSQGTWGWGEEPGISSSGKEARDCGHEGPGLTGGARLSQLRALDLQIDEKGPSQIKLK